MKEKSFKDLIAGALKVFRENLLSLLLLSVFVFLPVAAANVFIAERILDNEIIDQFAKNPDAYISATDYDKIAVMSSVSKQYVAFLFASFVISLFALAGNIVIVNVTYNSVYDIKQNFTELFESSLKRYPRVLWASLIANIFILLGLLIILPGLFFYFLFAFTVPVTVLFNLKGMKALQYGAYVVRKRLLMVIGFTVLRVAFNFAFTYLTSLPVALIPYEGLKNIINVIILSVNSLILCIPNIAFTLLFLDLQKKVEENVNVFFNISYHQSQS